MPAKYRSIQTSFWNDTWVIQLTPEQKYFFIYVLTNPKVSQCGIYEISLKQIEFETGYNRDTIEKLLKIFEKKGKIKFSINTSEICITNFSKYNYNSSPKVMIHIINELNKVKDKSLIQYIYGIDTIYKGYVNPSDTISQEKQKEQEKGKEKQKEVPDIELIKNFLEYFGFKEQENKEKYTEVEQFVNWLINSNMLNTFKKQFDAYKAYKVIANEKIHGFKSFIGNPLDNYKDGGWQAENWIHKLKFLEEHKPSAKGKPDLQENYQTKTQDHAASNL